MPYFEAGIPRRISYLIDPQGVIAKSYNLDSADDIGAHGDTILADIAELSAD